MSSAVFEKTAVPTAFANKRSKFTLYLHPEHASRKLHMIHIIKSLQESFPVGIISGASTIYMSVKI